MRIVWVDQNRRSHQQCSMLYLITSTVCPLTQVRFYITGPVILQIMIVCKMQLIDLILLFVEHFLSNWSAAAGNGRFRNSIENRSAPIYIWRNVDDDNARLWILDFPGSSHWLVTIPLSSVLLWYNKYSKYLNFQTL